ncbi:hypothetical protein HYH02_013999 [Chlamydomonas schloesseri]|uniref:Protein kinase domain-containing protein n=1 Tax=Chlamydomonas schloesseri TaxID=2026947 RepID=A0A835SPY1_9CHLO|nr:hypothetical protein HYH02_013999 [Chlamydomonas schloesseri]|eukprot:KAG2429661.1 hypothetical protein HYH02_013999 [Chlamydomonas schloesseri]
MSASVDNAPRAGPPPSFFTSSYASLVQQAIHVQAVTTFAFPTGDAVPADAPLDCVADVLEHGCRAFAALPLLLAPDAAGVSGADAAADGADVSSVVTGGGGGGGTGLSGSFRLGPWRQPLGVLVLACGAPSPAGGASSPSVAFNLLRDVDALQQVAAAVTLTLSAAASTPGVGGGAGPGGIGGGGGGFLAWLSGCLRRLADASSLHALVWELGEALAAHVRQRFLLDHVSVTAALLPDSSTSIAAGAGGLGAGGGAGGSISRDANSVRAPRTAYLLTADAPPTPAPAAPGLPAAAPATATGLAAPPPPPPLHSGAFSHRSIGAHDLSGHGCAVALSALAQGSRGGGVPSAGAPRTTALLMNQQQQQQLQQQQQQQQQCQQNGQAVAAAAAATAQGVAARCDSPPRRAGGSASDKYAKGSASGPKSSGLPRALQAKVPQRSSSLLAFDQFTAQQQQQQQQQHRSSGLGLVTVAADAASAGGGGGGGAATTTTCTTGGAATFATTATTTAATTALTGFTTSGSTAVIGRSSSHGRPGTVRSLNVATGGGAGGIPVGTAGGVGGGATGGGGSGSAAAACCSPPQQQPHQQLQLQLQQHQVVQRQGSSRVIALSRPPTDGNFYPPPAAPSPVVCRAGSSALTCGGGGGGGGSAMRTYLADGLLLPPPSAMTSAVAPMLLPDSSVAAMSAPHPQLLPSLHAKPFDLSHTLFEAMLAPMASGAGGAAANGSTAAAGAGSGSACASTSASASALASPTASAAAAAAAASGGAVAAPGKVGAGAGVLLGAAVADCSKWMQGVDRPSRDLYMLISAAAAAAAAGSGCAAGSVSAGDGLVGIKSLALLGIAPGAADGAAGAAGAGTSGGGGGGGPVLGLYLAFGSQLPPRLLEAVQTSCASLVREALYDTLRRKLAPGGQLGEELATLRAGVPGDYGVCPVVTHTTLPAASLVTASGTVGAATTTTYSAACVTRPCSSACNAVDVSAAACVGGGASGGVPLPPMLSLHGAGAGGAGGAGGGGYGLSSGLTAEGLPRARLGRTTTNASSICPLDTLEAGGTSTSGYFAEVGDVMAAGVSSGAQPRTYHGLTSPATLENKRGRSGSVGGIHASGGAAGDTSADSQVVPVSAAAAAAAAASSGGGNPRASSGRVPMNTGGPYDLSPMTGDLGDSASGNAVMPPAALSPLCAQQLAPPPAAGGKPPRAKSGLHHPLNLFPTSPRKQPAAQPQPQLQAGQPQPQLQVQLSGQRSRARAVSLSPFPVNAAAAAATASSNANSSAANTPRAAGGGLARGFTSPLCMPLSPLAGSGRSSRPLSDDLGGMAAAVAAVGGGDGGWVNGSGCCASEMHAATAAGCEGAGVTTTTTETGAMTAVLSVHPTMPAQGSMASHMGLLVEALVSTLRDTASAAATATANANAAAAAMNAAGGGDGGAPDSGRGSGMAATANAANAAAAAAAAGNDDLEDLQLYDILGEGAGGVVLQGLLGANMVAVKLMEVPGADEEAAATTGGTSSLRKGPAATGGGGSGSGVEPEDAAAAAAAEEAAAEEEAAEAARRQQVAATRLAARRNMMRNAMELAVLQTVSHVNIVQCHAVYNNVRLARTPAYDGIPASCYLRRSFVGDPTKSPDGSGASPLCTAVVTELCDCGSLMDCLAARSFPRLLRPPAASAAAAALAGGGGGASEQLSLSGGAARQYDMHGVYLTLLEVALALRHMHSRRLVHRDVKPANVLLKSSPGDPRGWTCKLADFGFCLVLDQQAALDTMDELLGSAPAGAYASAPSVAAAAARRNNGYGGGGGDDKNSLLNTGEWMAAAGAGRQQAGSGGGGAPASSRSGMGAGGGGGGGGGAWFTVQDQACGTVTHMAPEAMRKSARIDSSADVFSFGVIMWEIMCGRGSRPYPKLHPDAIPKAVMSGMRPAFSEDVPAAYRRLAQQCWAADPSLRPRAGDLVVAIKTLLVQNAALRSQQQAQQQQQQQRQQG